MKASNLRRLAAALLVAMLMLPGCLETEPTEAGAEGATEVTLTVWHSFAAESKEEEVFTNSISSFKSAYPNVTVEVTMVPFGNADQLFMTAAQGGQAPDLMRLSSDQLGAIGEVRVDGFPLLEDLRPHLTPQDLSLIHI